MTNSSYLSFFGSVENAPETSSATERLAAVRAEAPCYGDQSREGDERDHLSGYLHAARIAHYNGNPDLRADLYQERDGVEAAAWDQGDGSAVLLVSCPLAGWLEAAAVVWPLRFTAPAAVAGACCAPRYGLHADAY